MSAVKMNITLPERTAKKLRKAAPARERSKVIAEALELYFQKQTKTQLVRELIEVYSARANENSPETREWLDAKLHESDDEG